MAHARGANAVMAAVFEACLMASRPATAFANCPSSRPTSAKSNP